MALEDNPILFSLSRLLVGLFIGQENLQLYDNLDWQAYCDRFIPADFTYPEYYQKDFHGISGGYLTPIAPVTYDAVTRFAAPPNEIKLRQKAIAKVKTKPQKILDLGCGTGSTTILLQQTFPHAKVTGLDLSPYMLAIADRKAKQAGLNIRWLHNLAEATELNDAQFDLITASLLFHETPPQISQAILRESSRLLKPGGEILILDGNQKTIQFAGLGRRTSAFTKAAYRQQTGLSRK